ncbi:uncharacterized protein LOC109857274 [Pseudomyrmex gracilis]|uniref:uncharacterized protein LOC109857274 n=1 Tax=Pseudomyrmex gracilis TaxID=219809 RepID=UPI00099568B4|nr:uncharacterized protein LOC109857274 [Pseudomyrmex gracilis]
MARTSQKTVFHALLIISTMTLARCALLEMSRMLWNKTVSGGLTKIGKLDPLRIPLIKVDQSEGNATYRMILRNLEIAGLNESVLESIHVIRGALRSNPSESETGYVSYSDLRDVDSVGYRFHTATREPKENFETVVSSVSQRTRADVFRPSSRYQDRLDGRLRQNQQDSRIFEQNRHYDRQFFRPDTSSDGAYRSDFIKTSGDHETRSSERFENFKRPTYVQPLVYEKQRTGDFQNYRGNSRTEDAIDCDDSKNARYEETSLRDNRQHGSRQDANGRRHEDVEVSASETVETRLKNRADARSPALYNREEPKSSDLAASGNVKLPKTTHGITERPGFIDIIYTGDKAENSKRFGNFGADSGENRRVFGIDDVMKYIRDNARFIVYNLTEGEALRKKNDMVKAAIETKRLKDQPRYARTFQEQQGYFEEGMTLFYHFGENDTNGYNASRNINNSTQRTKRAHTEEDVENDVMRVILKIRVPLLRVKSQYTLTGNVGKEALRGDGLFAGNFTDVVGDFTLELKKAGEELMIVRAAKAKLSAKDQKISLQGMNEKGPVRVILNQGLTAAEAVAAMLADDLATKGLSEKPADALIYKMYKDLPVN